MISALYTCNVIEVNWTFTLTRPCVSRSVLAACQLLHRVDMIQPCVGVRREHLDRDAAQGFSSVVRDAERALDNADKGVVEALGWGANAVKGFLSGPTGVSEVLGSVGNHSVFWSRQCSGIAFPQRHAGMPPRCGGCMVFARERLLVRAQNAAKASPPKHAPNIFLSSPQKVCRALDSC